MLKRLLLTTAAAAAILAAAACSNTQLQQVNTALNAYDQAVQNFNAAAARINVSIALTSTTVAAYCQDAKAAGSNLTGIVQNNSKALTALNKVTAGLNSYCAAPPTDIGGTVVALTAVIAAAKAAGG